MPIKTFRGLMQDGAQDTVSLHTNNGATGYRIVKFQIIAETPTSAGGVEHIVQIWKTKQATVPTAAPAPIDFSNQVLLGAAIYIANDDPQYAHTTEVIFDQEIFNQDIYITHTDTNGNDPVNYYIELEQVKLDLNENTVATLKDIRNNTTR
jgi:hypothetical protein